MTSEQQDAVLQKLDEINTRTIETATLMRTLIGNGKPGRIDNLEAQMDKLEAYKNKSVGVIAVFSLLFETAVHWLFHKQ